MTKKTVELSPLDIYHHYPLDDKYPHLIDGRDAALGKCPCKPLLTHNGQLIIHNSFDGREIIEEFERRKLQNVQ